jgi:hypothetical protein
MEYLITAVINILVLVLKQGSFLFLLYRTDYNWKDSTSNSAVLTGQHLESDITISFLGSCSGGGGANRANYFIGTVYYSDCMVILRGDDKSPLQGESHEN